MRLGIGVQHLLQLAQRRRAHARQALGEADGRLAVQHQGTLGDVLGQIADAFQFRGGLDRGQGLAQIHRHRLAQGQQFERAVFDLLLDGVDAGVAPHARFRRGAVAPGDGFDGRSELGLGQAAHLGDQGGQALQLLREGLHGVIGHRVGLLHLVRPWNRDVPPLLCDAFITLP